ncbi:3-mercaptopyruvate sulfurtransferase [Pseudovibrio exalbescens]|uniref:3-mercaptopyruvate sulfurtransferase n=1 Tax=Pseudovibrio exalbescens TaxID=197461 RepID=UPI0023667348|nr:3-mercaptopyruvate sulfurtransferase [Pseudovibrio exalbescens]MDD7908444.1 3-mercaptopyruvate sulfurtransferase [Pseudovibrio exalbescens]
MPGTPLVTTNWLAENLSRPDLVVLDASFHLPTSGRDAKQEFVVAHIPGAQFFDIEDIADQNTDLPHMLPSDAEFTEKVSALGVGNDKTVVLYDAAGIFSAPRAWWMLRIFGLTQVYVLDGGLPKWRAEGRPLSDTLDVPVPGTLKGMLDTSKVYDLEQVKDVVNGADGVIVDARGRGRFTAEEPEPREGMRSGHMPGAKSVPLAELLVDGAYKSPQDLKKIFHDAGINANKRAVCTCGSGVTAAGIALGLTLIGHEDHVVYDGSWAEWGSRQDTPISTGSA